jgi:hypothetical protein
MPSFSKSLKAPWCTAFVARSSSWATAGVAERRLHAPWMMYSAPTGFDGSSLQSRTLGMGSDSFVCTTKVRAADRATMAGTASDLQYAIIATSELVLNLGGPAILVGTLATTREPLSIVRIKTRLNQPSFFWRPTTLVAPGQTRIARSQSAEKSN